MPRLKRLAQSLEPAIEWFYDTIAKNTTIDRSFVNGNDVVFIKTLLGIETLTNNELQAMRNDFVAYWGDLDTTARQDDEIGSVRNIMSAVTAIIDSEKSKRGMEV